MTKKCALYSASAAILLLSLLLATPSGAVNLLEGIALQKAGDTVVVTITTSEQGEFNAFLLEAKPQRIVVDLQGVTNSLKQKRFMSLPCKSIESIRTSQYKTSPSLVSRVVLDINRPVEFKSTRKGKNIMIKLPAIEGESEFASWKAKTTAPAPKERAAKTETPPKQVSESAAPSEKQASEAAASPEQAAEAATPPEKKEPAKKPRTSGVQIEAYPERKMVDYGTGSLRDPFVPLIGRFSGQLKGEVPSLENLKLVGILEDSQRNWALLEDSEGNGYMLTPNDRVKNGYLVSVSKNKAVFQVTEYGWTRTVALELKVPELE
jgi:hypothetical protein